MRKLLLLLVTMATPALAQNAELVGRASFIDADTIEIQGSRVRLFGIDAPESRQSCSDDQDRVWPCGRRSANITANFVGERTVTCKAYDTDKYGRTVAKCYVGTVDIGEWEVSNGLAVAYRKYSMDYVAAENSARAAKRGVWSGTFEMPWDFRHHRRGEWQ